MSDMKCPFCLQEMHKNQDNWFYCGTDYCELKHIDMPKKALEYFAESYQNRLNDCKRIGDLNEELIHTRKALDIAIESLNVIAQHEQRLCIDDPWEIVKDMAETAKKALGNNDTKAV